MASDGGTESEQWRRAEGGGVVEDELSFPDSGL